MKRSVAGGLLRALTEWDDDELDARLVRLLAMAEWKWDSYQGYRAGQRFIESLVRWLQEFDDLETRRRWVHFVLDRLVFVSSAEMDQAIACVYPDHLRPLMLDRAAAALDEPRYRTALLAASTEFKVALRRTLVLGLSDGARLDSLRRASPGLSHEQFSLSAQPDERTRVGLLTKLSAALAQWEGENEATFNHVLLVDDFYGSGTSLVKTGNEGGTTEVKADTKLGRFLAFVGDQTGDAADGAMFARDLTMTVVLYVASAAAVAHIRRCLSESGLDLKIGLWVVQTIPDDATVADGQLLADCDEFWDPVLEDEYKGMAARGYRSGALPVVLYHNAPNNSVCPLWADSTDRTGKSRRALFPRYERHHPDRR